MTNDELQVIKTVDEDGKEVELKLLDIVTVNDKDYALLLPKDEDIEDEEAEVVLMRLKKENDEYLFEVIDNDEEFDTVAKILSEDDECDCEGGCSCNDNSCDCGCNN